MRASKSNSGKAKISKNGVVAVVKRQHTAELRGEKERSLNSGTGANDSATNLNIPTTLINQIQPRSITHTTTNRTAMTKGAIKGAHNVAEMMGTPSIESQSRSVHI